MKKTILSGAFIVLLIHIILFCSAINYFSQSETFSFYDVTASEISLNENRSKYYSENLTDEQRALYINPDLEALLSDCEFESVNFFKAFSVAARSRNAKQIVTLFVNGERTLFQNKEYMRGRLLFFDDGSVFFGVTYSENGIFSYTVYRVGNEQELLNNYQKYINEPQNKNMLSFALGFICKNYLNTLTEPYAIVPQVAVVVVCFGLWIIKRQKANSQDNNSDTEQ